MDPVQFPTLISFGPLCIQIHSLCAISTSLPGIPCHYLTPGPGTRDEGYSTLGYDVPLDNPNRCANFTPLRSISSQCRDKFNFHMVRGWGIGFVIKIGIVSMRKMCIRCMWRRLSTLRHRRLSSCVETVPVALLTNEFRLETDQRQREGECTKRVSYLSS